MVDIVLEGIQTTLFGRELPQGIYESLSLKPLGKETEVIYFGQDPWFVGDCKNDEIRYLQTVTKQPLTLIDRFISFTEKATEEAATHHNYPFSNV